MTRTFYIQITEIVNHAYKITADTEEQAIEIIKNLTDDQRREMDKDGSSHTDFDPWDVQELED